MRTSARRFGSLAAAVMALAALAPSYAAPRGQPGISSLPALVLWAWERPVDLRSAGDGVAVAFLSQTISVGASRVQVNPRRQPLKVAPSTPLIAVTRIEATPGAAQLLAREQVAAIASRIAVTSAGLAGVQVDFDARRSERGFYRTLLRYLRAAVGERTPLTITALASWCQGDDWLDGLPIDGAVPMLFRMEHGESARVEPRMTAPACRGAVGTSLDEALGLKPRGRRVYVFNPNPWSEASLADARALVTR